MAKLVVSGATLACSMGNAPSQLVATEKGHHSTATGAVEHGTREHVLGPVELPMPSSPYELSPQHSTPPESSSQAEL